WDRAACWEHPAAHTTRLEGGVIRRRSDALAYAVHLPGGRGEQTGPHTVRLRPDLSPTGGTPAAGGVLDVVLELVPRKVPPLSLPSGTCPAEPAESEGTSLSGPVVRERAAAFWAAHWDRVGMLDLSRTEDPRAHELERRAVLSLYLQRIHAAGVLPRPSRCGAIPPPFAAASPSTPPLCRWRARQRPGRAAAVPAGPSRSVPTCARRRATSARSCCGSSRTRSTWPSCCDAPIPRRP